MQWWLISDADVKKIRTALESAEILDKEQCNASGCMCDMQGGEECGAYAAAAIHTLDSGLHTTDVVPSDFQASDED